MYVSSERKSMKLIETPLKAPDKAQMSVTDPDAKLMKSNEGFCVGYNPQVAVDAESHLIAGYMMKTTLPTTAR